MNDAVTDIAEPIGVIRAICDYLGRIPDKERARTAETMTSIGIEALKTMRGREYARALLQKALNDLERPSIFETSQQ